MRYARLKSGTSTLDEMLGEASWLISHAEALADYGRQEEARAELERAARCEVQVACLLDAAGREQEAGVHRISAASCYEQIGQYVQAVTLLRAALSVPLPAEHRLRVERLLARCMRNVHKELSLGPSQAARR
jgi:tetratricopeptide (TPR) repeat protein